MSAHRIVSDLNLAKLPRSNATSLVLKSEDDNDFLTFDTANNKLKPGQDVELATGKELSLPTADKLKSGGIIVPTEEELSFIIGPHASITVYNLICVRTACKVTAIDARVNLAQGGARTATVVKATGNTAPAAATTPMHTADAIDCNAAAHAAQSIALTATEANLTLAAGERIGFVLNGALSTGSITITIKTKRV